MKGSNSKRDKSMLWKFQEVHFSSFSVCTAASVTFIAFCRRTQISGIIFTGMYRVLTRKADTQTSVGRCWRIMLGNM